ncbi:hypothetical protein DW1_2814 [Proteiniborus sp. DW1]|uniref:sodium ion-translocating decarboxylase subunit beta n=1 Tax=Proteiniborus sp. DW1 TaxID=1889883 RepID=UPI00092DF4D2|nr:sodium ion-translocating decarboxylase subunit beta [Proteiniborus sp. DW1]SCG84374.1 hypothetical protein DW1_2814 [Proteiniborus sp. DW1]
MDKRKFSKIVFIITLITGIVTIMMLGFDFLLPIFLSFKLKRDIKHGSSIGIIGGADGPTTIFISSQSSSHLLTGLFGLLTIAGIIILLTIRKQVK